MGLTSDLLFRPSQSTHLVYRERSEPIEASVHRLHRAERGADQPTGGATGSVFRFMNGRGQSSHRFVCLGSLSCRGVFEHTFKPLWLLILVFKPIIQFVTASPNPAQYLGPGRRGGCLV